MVIGTFSRKFFVIIFFTSLLFAFIPATDGAEVFFPFEKIKPGMTGYGYTVFMGTKIEKFNFKVQALVDGINGQKKLILVRLSGKLLEKNGGLAAGMSGSPVYIGRKLVGAVSYGFESADPFLALVTPIQEMLDLLNSEEKTRVNAVRFNLQNRYTSVFRDTLAAAGLHAPARPVPIVSPVLVTGMGSRGFNLISRLLAKNGLKAVFWPVFGKNKEGDIKVTGIKPGSAISVQMISGDYQVSAIGTVTYINNDVFLAFGHSFTNKGAVDYLAFKADISQTVKSPELSFKLGSPIKIIGRITQDRQAGILGRFGETPALITVIVNVKDLERNMAKLSSFQVITNEQLYPDLIISGVTDAIDKTIDRVGGGTATVAVKIETAERAEAIFRTNIYYGKDIAVSCLRDLEDLLNILASNEFSKVDVKTVKIDIEVQNRQVSARILQLESERKTVKPGETFTVNAHIHTYRSGDFKVPFEIKLPVNIEPGKLVLNISGGSKHNLLVEDNGEEDQKKGNPGIDREVRSLSELLTKYTSMPKNNDLVLEYSPFYSESALKSSNVPALEKDAQGRIKPVKLTYQTDYVIFGEAQVTVEVDKP